MIISSSSNSDIVHGTRRQVIVWLLIIRLYLSLCVAYCALNGTVMVELTKLLSIYIQANLMRTLVMVFVAWKDDCCAGRHLERTIFYSLFMQLTGQSILFTDLHLCWLVTISLWNCIPPGNRKNEAFLGGSHLSSPLTVSPNEEKSLVSMSHQNSMTTYWSHLPARPQRDLGKSHNKCVAN